MSRKGLESAASHGIPPPGIDPRFKRNHCSGAEAADCGRAADRPHLSSYACLPNSYMAWFAPTHLKSESLRSALEQARKWELVPRRVATLAAPPRAVHHRIQPFTPEQARQFLDAMKDNRLEALYSVAIAIGLRQGRRSASSGPISTSPQTA